MRNLVFLVGAAALVLPGCRGDSSSPEAPVRAASAPSAREVRVVPAARERLARRLVMTGTLAAEEQVMLSTKVAGRVSELRVDLGSRVRAGDVLARLVTTDFQLRVEQAEAALQQARARLGLPPEGTDDGVVVEETAVVRQARAVLDEARLTRDRIATFVGRGLSARSELDAAEAAFKVAEGRYQDALEEVRNRQALLLQRRSELALARQQLQDAELRAPFDGMIRERQASVGQYVAPGTPICTLVRVHPLRLRLDVPEREAAFVRTGQEVVVSVEGDPARYRGRVARISPAIAEANRTLPIEAEVPNPEAALRPGSFARAEITLQSNEPAVVVPASAIVTFAGIQKVITVQKDRAVELPVETGRREGDRVEILSGLEAGAPVILDPGNIVSGEPVRVRQ